MEIKYSTQFIKIIFDKNEPFSGKTVRIKGEALANGFDADLKTAEWLIDHIGYPVSHSDISGIRKVIEKHNTTNSFQILFMGE